MQAGFRDKEKSEGPFWASFIAGESLRSLTYGVHHLLAKPELAEPPVLVAPVMAALGEAASGTVPGSLPPTPHSA